MINFNPARWTDKLRPGKPVPPNIQPGSRFVSADLSRGVWEVVAVARYLDQPIPHVRLVRVGKPTDTKTVSVEVLMDRHFYHPAEVA